MEQVFRVPKIKCEGCAETIRHALSGLTGVMATRVMVSEKEVHVELDPALIDPGRVRLALTEAGFPAG